MEVIASSHIEEVPDCSSPIYPETPSDFHRKFQRLFEDSPSQAVKLFLLYLEAQGLDDAARSIARIATSGTLYISLVMDADSKNRENLPSQAADKIIPLLNELDSQFLFKFARSLAKPKDADSILRALRIVPLLGDYSILIPCLRRLAEHPDSRIRSRSAKLLCTLRPNKGLIDRYMQSHDARVRAGAVEALWNLRSAGNHRELMPLLRSAVHDSHHRVVANALVGLFRLAEEDASQRLLSLCAHKHHLFRAAAAWAIGTVEDSRAIPVLQRLTLDHSYTVRQRATSSLRSLDPNLGPPTPLPTSVALS